MLFLSILVRFFSLRTTPKCNVRFNALCIVLANATAHGINNINNVKMDRNKRIKEIADKIYDNYINNGWKNVSLRDCELKAINYIDTGDIVKNEFTSFDEWTKQQGFKQDFFYFKKDKEYLKPSEVFKRYKQDLKF
jgi:hypothetical protein